MNKNYRTFLSSVNFVEEKGAEKRPRIVEEVVE